MKHLKQLSFCGLTMRGTVICCDAGVISGSLLYRCIVRYGYRDIHQDVDSFETELVKKLSYFIQYDWYQTRGSSMSIEDDGSHSNKSSSYILTVIGTTSFCSQQGYESQQSVQNKSSYESSTTWYHI